jgi:hypothetical protein
MKKLILAVECWMKEDNGSDIIGMAKEFCVFGPIFLAGVFSLVLLIVLVAGSDKNADIVLNRDDWQCTHSHTTLVGKVVEDVCDTYRMKGYENQ